MKNISKMDSNIYKTKHPRNIIIGASLVSLIMYTNSVDPINLPKFLVLIILGMYSVGNLNFVKIANDLHSKLIFYSSTLFIVGLFISSLISDSSYIGIFGEYQRKNGFLTYLSLVLVMFSISQNFALKNTIFLLRIILFLALIEGFYGYLQSIGKDPIKWSNPYNSIIGTLGNPNFASAFMAILSTFILMSIFTSRVFSYTNLFSFILVCLLFRNIVSSQSRQGLLALFAGVGIGVSILLFLKNRKLGFISFLLYFSLIVLGILGMLQKGPLASLLYKDSVSVRGFYWRAAIKMFESKPIFGVGVDQYGYFFKQFREPAYSVRYGSDITSSNAHSVPLQLLSTGGIFVFLAYICLIITVSIVSITSIIKLKNQAEKNVVIVVFSSWVTYQAQSLISIDNIGLAVWNWIFSGILLAFYQSLKERNSWQPAGKKNTFQRSLALTGLVISIVPVSILFTADQKTRQVQNLFNPNNNSIDYKKIFYQKSIQSINAPLQDPTYKYLTTTYMIDMGYADEALKFLEGLHRNFPRNQDVIRALIYMYTKRNQTINVKSLREYLEVVDPYNYDNLYELALLYKANNELDKSFYLKSKILHYAENTVYGKKAVENL